MFDRFTNRAKQVMSFTRQNAERLNHWSLGPEHMLLGIVDEGTGVAANVMRGSVELSRIRSEVERLLQPGKSKPMPSGASLPFTPAGKHVFERAMEEAKKLGHNYIGTEHLLLALVGDQGGIAAQALKQLGFEHGALSRKILAFIAGEDEDWPGP